MKVSKYSSKPVALIAGVTGAVGTALARELAIVQGWHVYGVSRQRPVNTISEVSYHQADLANAEHCNSAFAALTDITHVFYCARATHAEQVVEDVSANLFLLENLVETVERHSKELMHVHLVQGGKYYGVHVGPFPTPAVEEQARVPIPNFNYDQQDYLQQRSKTANWSWTASRPNTLLHYSPDNARNLVSSLGAYAAICRELGAALDFPGSQGAFDSLTQVTTLELLARAIAWMSNEPRCANQAFNVTNTDVFRWSSVWPHLADVFGMPAGSVRPLRLADVMASRERTWSSLRDRHQLNAGSLQSVVNWGYLDATLERYWDEVLCHNKIRQFGFDSWDDSQSRLLLVLEEYQKSGVLPR